MLQDLSRPRGDIPSAFSLMYHTTKGALPNRDRGVLMAQLRAWPMPWWWP